MEARSERAREAGKAGWLPRILPRPAWAPLFIYFDARDASLPPSPGLFLACNSSREKREKRKGYSPSKTQPCPPGRPESSSVPLSCPAPLAEDAEETSRGQLTIQARLSAASSPLTGCRGEPAALPVSGPAAASFPVQNPLQQQQQQQQNASRCPAHLHDVMGGLSIIGQPPAVSSGWLQPGWRAGCDQRGGGG